MALPFDINWITTRRSFDLTVGRYERKEQNGFHFLTCEAGVSVKPGREPQETSVSINEAREGGRKLKRTRELSPVIRGCESLPRSPGGQGNLQSVLVVSVLCSRVVNRGSLRNSSIFGSTSSPEPYAPLSSTSFCISEKASSFSPSAIAAIARK